jgi:hypothetical protein
MREFREAEATEAGCRPSDVTEAAGIQAFGKHDK